MLGIDADSRPHQAEMEITLELAAKYANTLVSLYDRKHRNLTVGKNAVTKSSAVAGVLITFMILSVS